MSSLKTLAIRGAIWTIAGYGAGQLLRLGGNLVLTRLLEPKLFGLMTLVFVFITALHLFSDLGIGVSVIQNKRGDDPVFLNTAWTLQVVRGVFLWVCALLIAWPVSHFYEERQLLWLIPVVALTTVISGFNSTSLYSLNRHMEVSKVAMFEFGGQAITIGVAIAWASFDRSIRALVIGSLVSSLAQLVWSYRMIPNSSQKFTWEKESVKELFSFGKWIFISTAITFFAEQADRLILGKLLPLELLGVYGVAMTFADLPRQVTSALSSKVIFPAISKIADLPRQEIRAKLLHNRRLILLALTFGLSLLVCFGDFLIKVLYDQRYIDAAWMLPILALGIWPRMLCNTNEPSLLAIAKPQYGTFAHTSRFLFTSIGVLVGFHYFKVLGAVVAVAFNDLVYYSAINYGLWREGLSCLMQDLLATLLLVGLLALGLIGRYSLGFGLPIEALL
jgi:O-antigen/teichoic acid export membrane protein